jgi:sugar lactone lactonase YvrE
VVRVRFPRSALYLVLAVCVTAGVIACLAAWEFWPLLSPDRPRPPGPGWTPAAILVAGTGRQGASDGDAGTAQFSDPFAVAVGPDGTIYVADGGAANAIRCITPSGRVSTLAGGGEEGFADGRGTGARFSTPSAVVVAPDGTLYVADTGNHVIRRVSPDGLVTTVAGDGTAGWRDGNGVEARFDGPMGLALDRQGRLLVADSYNDRIRSVGLDGQVRTVAGAGQPGLADGLPIEARFDTPTGLAFGPDGALLVADTGNDLVRRVGPDGVVTTVGGLEEPTAAMALSRPIGIAATADGRLYVTDRRGWILELTMDGAGRSLAGGAPGFLDGLGPVARFRDPTGLALTSDGAVIVADRGNRMVRELDLPSRLGARLPAPPGLRTGFDLERFARLPLVWPLDPQEGPHEVAGTLGEARGNPGGDGHERFHGGGDVHADEGALVLAVRDGKVDQPIATGGFGALNEYVSIGPVTYVHLRVGRDRRDEPLDPDEVAVIRDGTGRGSRVRVRRGWRLHAGQAIGTVNRFQHVHLSIGPSGEEANALDIGLPGFVDTIPPTIARRGVELTDLAGRPLTERVGGRLLVAGPIRIIVEAWDRVDGNVARRRLGVYRLGYQLLKSGLEPAPGFESPRMTISFDRLPADPDAPLVLYAPGSGIPFYGARRTRFRYVVTTRNEDGYVVEAPLDLSGLTPGDYVLRAFAADASGNQTRQDVPISLR